MKKGLITSFAIMLMVSASLADQTTGDSSAKKLNWLTDPVEAQQLATEQGLPILMDFTGSDWCKWCVRLDQEVFSQQAFVDYANENLVLVKLDFPRRKLQPQAEKQRNEQYAKQYRVRGFPTIMLLNADGSVIAQTGYQQGGAVNYVNHIESLMP